MNKYRTTLLILIAAVTPLSVPASSNHPQDKPRAGKVSKEGMEDKAASKQKGEPKKAPEGVSVKGNTATLKTGYQFVKQVGGAIAVEKKGGGIITGKFYCYCGIGGVSDDCSLKTTGNSATCAEAGKCKNCILDMIVDNKTSPAPTKIKK